jgi:hypothetical protein
MKKIISIVKVGVVLSIIVGIDLFVAIPYNNLVQGNAFSLIITLVAIPVSAIMLFIGYTVNKCNREMGNTREGFASTALMIVGMFIMPIIAISLAWYFRFQGYVYVANVINELRFWSIVLPVTLFILWKKVPRRNAVVEKD